MHTTNSVATTETVESSTNDSPPSPSSKSPKLAPYFAVGPESQEIICPFCNEKVETSLRTKRYCYTAIINCLICLSCCFPAFCLLCFIQPLLPGSKPHHFCPKCNADIGRYRRP